jgi:hypothetical protein
MKLPAAFALCLTATLAACAEPEAPRSEVAGKTYDGPLHVDRDEASRPRAGAAGDVVDCRVFGDGGSSDSGTYAEGATADSPDEALEVARGEGGFGGVQEGLEVAKQEDDRVLYVLEVDGAVKQAVILRDGPATEGAGGRGWYVESWAHCDYSELPRSFTDSIGLRVWTDESGAPAPTTAIESWTGPEHCDWQSMTFLHLGEADYVRDPLPDLSGFFAEEYDAHAELPADAVDTGYSRDGRHLWLSKDRKRAYVGTREDVELWPRTVEPLGCA